MFVGSECRGSAIAEMILLEPEKWAIEKGFFRSTPETAIKQPEAIRFYTRPGYKQIDNYGPYKEKTDHICMRKN